ncbi:MAG: FecR family protein [Crocinitomicaceae bacterium]
MDQLDDILAKHFSGFPLTDDEQTQLLKWKVLNESEYIAIENTMASTEGYQSVEFDTSKGWRKMSQRIDDQKETRFTLRPILKYGIAASIAIILGITGFQLFNKQKSEFIVFKNDELAAKQIELPDGSVVDLAKNTTLAYHPDFENNRDVELNGEAFFNVFRNENNPFTINTDYGNVTVLGTSFNVNTFEEKTQVDVKTGLVALTLKNTKIKLAVGESAWSDGIKISQKTDVNMNDLSWNTGEFYFENTPIPTVIKFLESFYGDVIDSNIESDHCSFSGSFSNQKIDGIIEALVLSCNLEFSKENNRFILK